MNSITTSSALRTQLQSLNLTSSLPIQQIRHATLIKRPKRPYTFTQLITLSDGSTFTQRTTSPQTVYLTVKDTKNSPLWNPSSQKLLNVEEDDAGRLRKFRERFGRGFDAEAKEVIIDDEVCLHFTLPESLLPMGL
jgi:ribosomal protein L31